jgi:type II secretory pathway component PulM
MAATTDPAGEHIRVMEARLRTQTALVVRLRQIGQDAFEAMRRLELQQRALEEMRFRLAQLSRTEMDTKNGRADVLLTRLLD